MRFGAFIAPFHDVGQNPTLALERDLELLEHLDRLGFDEAWIGEHHSGGFELIASPEVFIATAAERTKHLRLGSGVNSLPYHHPLLLADRFVLLDHLTRGRAMLGCGPGQLTSDAHMLGIPPDSQRPRMEEALDAIVRAARGRDGVDDDRLVRAARRAPPAAAVLGRRDRHGGRGDDLAVGPARRGTLRPRPHLDRRHDRGRLRRARRALGRDGAARRGVRPRRPTARSGGSSARCTSPRRRSRRGATSSSGSCSSPATSRTCCPTSPVGDAEDLQGILDHCEHSGFAIIGTPDDAIRQISAGSRSSPAASARTWSSGTSGRTASRRCAATSSSPATSCRTSRASSSRSRRRTTGSPAPRGRFVDAATGAITKAIEDHAKEQADKP